MIYEEFKEEFQEKIVQYLPQRWQSLQIEIEKADDTFKKYEVVHFTDRQHPDAELPAFDLTGVYQSVKEELKEKDIVEVFADFGEELTEVLDASYKEKGIEAAEEQTQMEKIDGIYVINSPNIDNSSALNALMRQEEHDFMIIQTEDNLIIVPEKEIPEEYTDLFLDEIETYFEKHQESKELYLYQKDANAIGMIQSRKERVR